MICIKKIQLHCGLVFLALGFSTAAMAAIQVDLDVMGSELIVTGNNAQCAGGPIECIDVEKGTKPNLFFNLKGACDASGPAYQLTAFRIGIQNKVWPTPSTPLPANIATDFNANPQTGYVDLSQGNNQLTDNKIKLKDKNNSSYSVYYRITATHCTDMSAPKIYLDPEIKNRG